MTIGELVRLLETYPLDMRVVVDGYEEGYDDLSPEQISVVRILLNTGTEAWQGRHGDPRDRPDRPRDHTQVFDALALSRASN